MQEQEFIYKYKEITETLSEYGWIISPYMIGKDFNKVYALVLKIRNNSNPTQTEKTVFLEEINQLLTDIIFHPLFRAFFVVRAKELQYLKSFSHHLEKAILHYYKNDYFSAVLCLLPAVEGCLLSYFGWEFGQSRKPSINKLIEEIEKCRMQTYDPVSYKMYSSALSIFLRNWIYSDTSTTDTTFSYLNRHYVLHGMGMGNYYSLSDVNRLIMFFDLLIEFLSIEERRRYVFIPENNKQIDDRSQYYFKFIESNIRKNEILAVEKILLAENTNFYVEKKIPNWAEILNRAVKEHLDFMNELDFKFGKDATPKFSLSIRKFIKNLVSIF